MFDEMITIIQNAERAKMRMAMSRELYGMIYLSGYTVKQVSNHTSRYTEEDLHEFICGNFKDFNPLEVLTHVATVIAHNFR